VHWFNGDQKLSWLSDGNQIGLKVYEIFKNKNWLHFLPFFPFWVLCLWLHTCNCCLEPWLIWRGWNLGCVGPFVFKNNRIRREIVQSKAHRSHEYVNNAWSEISNSPPTLLFIPFHVPPHWQTIWDNYFSPSLFLTCLWY